MIISCSAVLITNVFDHKCQNALRSLGDFAELLIFDSASGIQESDLKHPNAKIIPIPDEPITDFAFLRNEALRLTTQEWVFFLDSDEVLQPFSTAKLQKTLQTTTASGFFCTRSDFFHGKQLHYGEAGKQKLIRLVRASATRFTGKIHEVAQVAGRVDQSELLVYHFSHESISEFIADVTKYATQLGNNRDFSLFELLVYPPAKFVYTYIFLLGFLDGYRGLSYALIMTLHSITVRITAYEKNHA